MSPRKRKNTPIKQKNPAPLEEETVKKRSKKSDEATSAIQIWLNSIQKLKKNNDLEVPEIEIDEDEDFVEDGEDIAGIDGLDSSLRTILKQFSEDELKRSVLFECEWNKCSFEATDEEQYFPHVYSHFSELDCSSESFRCLWDLCHFTTKDHIEMSRHVNFHAYHTKLKIYGNSLATLITLPQCLNSSKQRNDIPTLCNNFVCKWKGCNESFSPFQDYLDHVQHHLSTDYTYKRDIPGKRLTCLKRTAVDCLWDGCGKTVNNVYVLRIHLRQHTREKFIACFNCGSSFASRKSLVQHHLRQFMTAREFQCAHCYKYYPTSQLLKDHERVHVNLFKCTLCDMSCSSKATLATHIRYKHIKERPFQCEQCDYSAVTKRDLDSHKNTHNTENIFKCEEFLCNFTCRSIKTLKRHSQQHCAQQQIYRCHVESCNKEYRFGTLLSKHLIKKHEFKHPSGHSRFIYKQDIDGIFRLQTKRIESIEVTKQILSSNRGKEPSNKVLSDVKFTIKDFSEIKGVSVNVDYMQPAQSSSAKNETAAKGEEIKKITDFAVMKKYLKTEPVLVEIEEQDASGKTVSKKTIKIDEYQV